MQYLIDASVYVFRAHYSMPDDMVDDDGNPINALYGYCRFLGNFMEQVNPEYVAFLTKACRSPFGQKSIPSTKQTANLRRRS